MLTSLVSGIQNPVLLREIQEAQAHLSILSGDWKAVTGWQALILEDKGEGLNIQKERETFSLARLYIAEGRPDEALEIIESWAADAAVQGRVRSQVTALCLQALAHFAALNLSQSEKLLTRNSRHWTGKGFRRLFLDEGRQLAALLQSSFLHPRGSSSTAQD
jgi:hypothetical protein